MQGLACEVSDGPEGALQSQTNPLIYVTFQGKVVVQGEDTFMLRTWDVFGVGGLEHSI